MEGVCHDEHTELEGKLMTRGCRSCHIGDLETRIAQLTAALQALADAAEDRLHEPNWIPLLNARRVLAAGEKP